MVLICKVQVSQGCYANANAKWRFGGMQNEDQGMQNEGQGMQNEGWGWTLDLLMMLEVDVFKVYYARDGVLGLIMTFRTCNIMVLDQEDKLIDGQFDRV